MTTTETDRWWTPEAIAALIDSAVLREVLADPEPIELLHSEITTAAANPDSPDQAYPGVAVVLRDAEPWLIHPHPAGWAATQAVYADFGHWSPIEGTTGLLTGRDQDPVGLIAMLEHAVQLPLGLDRADHVSAHRAHVDDDEERAEFGLVRDEALDHHAAHRALRDDVQDQLDRVHVAAGTDRPLWLSELVAAIVGFGYSLDPHGPHSGRRYHRGGPRLAVHLDGSAVLTWGWARATIIQFGTGWAEVHAAEMNDMLRRILAGQRWPAAQLRPGGQVYITGPRVPVPDHTTSDTTS